MATQRLPHWSAMSLYKIFNIRPHNISPKSVSFRFLSSYDSSTAASFTSSPPPSHIHATLEKNQNNPQATNSIFHSSYIFVNSFSSGEKKSLSDLKVFDDIQSMLNIFVYCIIIIYYYLLLFITIVIPFFCFVVYSTIFTLYLTGFWNIFSFLITIDFIITPCIHLSNISRSLVENKVCPSLCTLL